MTDLVPLVPAEVAVPVVSGEDAAARTYAYPSSDLQRYLAATVRAAARNRGWPQARVALEAGLSQKHLSQVLTGRAEGSLQMWDRLLKSVGAWPPG